MRSARCSASRSACSSDAGVDRLFTEIELPLISILARMEAAGIAPFAYGFNPTHDASSALRLLPGGVEEGEVVRLAGRLVAWEAVPAGGRPRRPPVVMVTAEPCGFYRPPARISVIRTTV